MAAHRIQRIPHCPGSAGAPLDHHLPRRGSARQAIEFGTGNPTAKRSCKVLRELAEYAGSTYEAMINEVFDSLKKGTTDEYAGVSKRLKSKFALEGSVQEQLRTELLNFR